MRFHCGISFSWRTIKKFLFPILIGFLAYFGLDFLGSGFINVNALENYQSWYDYNYTDLSSYENYVIDNNNVKFIDLVNTIKNRSDITLEYTIAFVINNNSISELYFFVFPLNQSYKFSVYGKGNNLVFYNGYASSDYESASLYSITLGNIADIYNNNTYLGLISCITSNTNCNNSAFWGREYTSFAIGDSVLNNTDDFTFTSNSIVLYYSTHDLLITNNYNTSNTSRFYKSLRVNNESVEVGSKFPTYTDYVNSQQLTPTPTPTPTPTDSITNHKALYDKIYWFDDNSTELGVLTSIYEVLFLYCLTMVLFKIFTILKNNRW